MATNQEGVHAAVRGETGTAYNYQGDWHALFDSDSIASGTFNERLLAWINAQLSTSYAGLPQAMQAFAEDQGFDSWSAMNTFSLFDISDLFASGEDGAWYDPSDLTTVFQERTGASATTPAEVGDVVGTILDKSGNANHAVAPSDAARPVLRDEIAEGTSVNVSGQSELVTNGDFATGDLTGWTLPNPFGSPTDWSVSGGEAVLDGTQTNFVYLRTASNIGATAGNWYVLELDITARTAGSVSLQNAGAVDSGHSSTSYTTTGTKLELFRSGGDGYIEIVADSNFNGSIDNISVKEVPASAARRYYLDTDGADDRMTISPTVDLITVPTWTHVGGWQVDADGDSPFGLSDQEMAPITASGAWNWYDTSSTTAQITSGSRASPQVLTIYQTDASNLTGRYNGTTGSTINPYDGSSPTAGLTLFSRENDAAAVPMAGRFYGGTWIDRQLTSAELASAEEYMAGKTGATLA